MSLENAILTHAEAVNNLAAAILAGYKLGVKATDLPSRMTNGLPALMADGEIDAAVSKVEKAAKAKGPRGTSAEMAAADLAVTGGEIVKDRDGSATAKADATKAKEESAAKADLAQTKADGAKLDYTRDVAPTLVQLAQKNRQALIDLLAEYGVKKGAEVKQADLIGLLDRATELLAD